MKMSRSGIVTSGRRPSRPDGNYYRESRKRSSGHRRRRRVRTLALLVLLILAGIFLYYWLH